MFSSSSFCVHVTSWVSEEVKLAKPDHELVAVEEPEDEDGGEESTVTKTQTEPSQQNTENGFASSGFTILGGHEQKKIQKVQCFLRTPLYIKWRMKYSLLFTQNKLSILQSS